MRALFRQTVQATVSSWGAGARIELQESYPGVVNHDDMTALAEAAARDLLGPENVRRIDAPTMGTEDFGWTMPFPDELIPEGIIKCDGYEGGLKPTVRNCDVPYKEGNYTAVVDGFLVTENVEIVSVENIVTGFVYADHNPVCLRFRLK